MTKFQKIAGILIAGIVVGLLFHAVASPTAAPTATPTVKLPTVDLGTPTDSLGGVYSQVANYFPNIYVPGEGQIGDSIEKSLAGTIGPTATIGSWQNTTGGNVYAYNGIVGYTSGTASSSLRASMFATTTPPSTITSIDNFATLANVSTNGKFLINAVYATSTTASTTNSMVELQNKTGSGLIVVPNNGYLVTFIQRGDTNCVALPVATGCEQATSTNRGIGTFFWKAKYVR